MNAQKSARLQRAAELVGDLADAVADMGTLLDKIQGEVGEEVWSRVQHAFPIETQFGGKANANIVKLMHQLTPPDYDPEDKRIGS